MSAVINSRVVRSSGASALDDEVKSNKPSRFPKKDTCLSIYSFTINSGKSLEQVLAERLGLDCVLHLAISGCEDSLMEARGFLNVETGFSLAILFESSVDGIERRVAMGGLLVSLKKG